MPLTPIQIQTLIYDEITVDCYDQYEVNMGWAIYMEEHLEYPFTASYRVEKPDGSDAWLRVDVVDNHSSQGNYHGGDYYVKVLINGILIPAALLQLRDIQADAATMQAIEVFRYEWG